MGILDHVRTWLGGSRLDVSARFERLGTMPGGTMSEVLLVRDRQTGEQRVLKLLDVKKSAAFEARFTGLKKPSEGEIAMAVSGPHIVQTLEQGKTTHAQAFLLLEHINGPTLESLIRVSDSWLDGRRVTLLRQAAGALAEVHRSGYLHRDICPQNFLVEKSAGSLKLIDFGLSIPARAEFLGPGNRTGKADYMAPELLRRQPIDQRVDVFAFGAMAWQLCAGRLPWQSGTGEQAIKRASQKVPELRQARPRIEPRLASAIESCLVVDPQARCAGMDDFLRAIRKVEREDVD